jgi:hypothetical protein
VGGDKWAPFHARLEQAEAELRRATQLAPDDHVPWTYLITVARGRSLGVDEATERFEQACDRFPLSRAAHMNLLSMLCAKWSGSHEMMFAFARETAESALAGSPLHATLAMAHVERWLFFSMEGEDDDLYFVDAEILGELFAVEDALFGSTYAGSPHEVADRNLLTFCYWLAGEYERALRQFAVLRGRVTLLPWCFFDEAPSAFAFAREECEG